jgi:hypothetical protein
VRKREAEYLSKVADIGCIICYRAGYSGTPAEIHHIRGLGLGMGVRNSHYNVLPFALSITEVTLGITGWAGKPLSASTRLPRQSCSSR